jgi:hypothetical protein
MLDKKRFDTAFNHLATATRLPLVDLTPETKRVYFDGLNDLPIEALESAAARLSKSAQWFPKVAEWREAAREIRKTTDLRAVIPGARAEDWRHECEWCEDGGWSYDNGLTLHETVMGGYKDMPRMQRCVCRATNSTYQRRARQFGGAS